ncbi:MAG: hypothetical protein WCS69_11375 [Ignavibacteriaceae bacterium]
MKKNYVHKLFLLSFLLASLNLTAQNDYKSYGLPIDTICSHKVIRDSNGEILPWYKPELPGEAYSHVINLAAQFIKDCPVEPTTKLKLYMVHADFDGPKQNNDFYKGTSGSGWMSNPACVFAGFVQSLAIDYRTFSGDTSYLGVVRECLDQMLTNGTTPTGWAWSNCPYASADPKSRIYNGATKWEDEKRGDGLYCIEPDKVGELGAAYLQFYEITGEEKYLTAAINCADALAKHVRDVSAPETKFATNFSISSPWAFRVNAKTGEVKDDYCSNVLDPVRLFDELIRIGDFIPYEKNIVHLPKEKIETYRNASITAWNWLFSKNGPMKTFIWNGYFEDVPSDSNIINRIQITPMETARYILKHPEKDSNWRVDVPALLHWVASAFAVEGMDAIREQTWCYEPMGSHTARYASVCALWYKKNGDERFKDEAFRFFNVATYMCEENGYVWTGPAWPTAWFTDGYGDYICHFMEGMAAVPEWAPADENHLLGSTSVIKKIDYSPGKIDYTTFDDSSTETLRLIAEPKNIEVNTIQIKKLDTLNQEGFTWEALEKGGILRIMHTQGSHITISI